MAEITMINTGQIISCRDGEKLLDVLTDVKESIPSPCGGRGSCGKCRVRIAGVGEALACETRVYGKMEIEVPDKREAAGTKIFSSSFGGAKTQGRISEWGLAVDIGTTTVEAVLLNLSDGTPAARGVTWNSQRRYGADVLSRIHYEMEHPEEGRQRLQAVVIKDINELIEKLCGQADVRAAEIRKAAVAGNCTMIHMLLGEDATGIGKAPYDPAFRKAQTQETEKLGLRIGRNARIYCFPQVSSFIGGDITAGLAVIPELDKETVLFADIGTNGEIVLAKGGRMAACSCAAGPALEGMNIRAGMCASDGAVEDVKISEEGVLLKVIGGTQPKGICGSGVLSAVRELLKNELIKKNGTYAQPSAFRAGDVRRTVLRMNGRKREAILCRNPEILLTQGDIRQIQLAKGAVMSGIRMLMSHMGIEPEKVEKVFVAGQFGSHLPEDALLQTGMFPKELSGKINYVGNIACQGACRALGEEKVRRRAEEIAEQVEYLELSRMKDYERIFAECILF